MRKIYILGLIVLSVALIGCGPENLQRSNPMDPLYNGGGEGFVEGFVRYSSGGMSVNGATVSLVNTTKTNTTGDSGHYFFDKAPTGNITLTVTYPWYSDSSQMIALAIGEHKTVDFSLSPGRPSNTFPCAFSPYTFGQIPPSPWSTNKFGSASILPTVDSSASLSASQSVKFTCGTNLNDYSELVYSGINGTKGARVKAAINVSSINQNSFMVGLKDLANNGPEIGIYNNNFYRKTPSGTGSILSGFGAPAQGIFYYVEMVYDKEAGSVAYSVYSALDVIMGIPYTITGQAKYSTDKVSVVLKDTSSVTTYAYIDDIDVLKK
ncbi:MAG: hypothetical protein A2452_04890 [Candidatus Firestonebacteria bacterium RIFOXYC2_FULL_39_67]|nr:MAG: hypothetical protein A2536_11425 [Candidatus Firestonebacteria bacterium RIFOXYD2_FULL_39_29]OGF55812.1 MAG: hypothetical protein A2452_04890 [Candidatus Firestonebacteria bacterium RIFOXYC2_FULL_39_67]